MMKYALKPLAFPLASLVAPLCFAPPLFAEENPPDLIVITASRQPVRISETLSDVTVLTREDIEKSGQETIMDLLARQPGLQVSRNGGPGTASSLFIRGTNSNQNKVLVDGVSINSLDGSGSPLRFIPLADVERIEILRGPASMLYGADAIGGVINIITRSPKPGFSPEFFVGYGTRNTGQANAALSGGNEQWRFRIEGNHLQTDGISAQTHATNHDADNDAYRNSGGAFSLSFLPAKGHEIGMGYRQNEGLAHYDSTPPDGDYDNRTRFKTTQWRIFSKNRFLPAWLSTVQYGASEDYQKDFSWNAWGFPPAEDISYTHTKNGQFSWQNDIDLPLGRALLMAEYQRQRVYPHAATDYLEEPKVNNTSFLAGWNARTGSHNWQINLRQDRHSMFGGKTTYGAAYGYQLTDALRAHISYGTAFKAPSIYQLFVDMPSWSFHGNADLKPETSKNTEIGVAWEQGNHQASATFYRNRVKDLIAYVSDPVTWESTYVNMDKALLEGATLSYQGLFGAWRFAATYDWLNAQNQSIDPSDNVGYERLGRRAKNRASASLAYTFGKLETGLEWMGVGRRYDRNYKENEANKDIMGAYGLLNLTARYALTRELSLEGRLNNLFNKKYETAVGYGTEGFNAFVGLRYAPR